MIPKQAFFTWVGDDELPWLRQLSVDSFKKQNPDWEVEVVRIPSEKGLLAAHATDIYRYFRLGLTGGLYVDTDILFFKPIPDELLDADVAITIDKSAFCIGPHTDPRLEAYPGFNNLSLLGAVPSNPFFRHIQEVAMEKRIALNDDNVSAKDMLYQTFGTDLLNREFCGKTVEDIEAQFGICIYNIQLEAVLPVPWQKAHQVFNGTTFDPAPETIGLHWYGGCVDAKRYCQQVTLDTLDRRPCLLTDVVKMVTA